MSKFMNGRRVAGPLVELGGAALAKRAGGSQQSHRSGPRCAEPTSVTVSGNRRDVAEKWKGSNYFGRLATLGTTSPDISRVIPNSHHRQVPRGLNRVNNYNNGIYCYRLSIWKTLVRLFSSLLVEIIQKSPLTLTLGGYSF